MKRFCDFLIAGAAVILLSPIFLFVTVAIGLVDSGPVFFRQNRVGKDCKEFKILKFRTMIVDAEKRGGHSTAINDPRITSIGKILRRTSIDELPQFINVLRGDMSIVGPRPDVPAQRADYVPNDWKMRHQVRPGITGPAQAKLRSSATPEQRLALDIEYATAKTHWADAKIILQTIAGLLSGRSN